MSKKQKLKLEKTRDIDPRICQGCLSLDRGLRSIEEHDGLNQIIVDNCIFENKHVVLLCWECVAVLKKIKLFKEQVRHATNTLRMLKRNMTITAQNSLSKLTICSIKEDSCIQYKSEDEKKELHPFDTINVFDSQDNLSVDTSIANISTNILFKETKIDLDDIANGLSTKLEVKQEQDDDYYDADFEDILVPLKTENDIKREKPLTYKQTRHEKYSWVKDYKKELIFKDKINIEDVGRYMEMERQCEFYLKATFKCDLCLMRFKTNELLEKHCEVIHSLTEPHRCVHCHSSYTTDSQLQHHIQTHLICYRCRACTFESYTKSSISKHIKVHHGCVKCNFCGYFTRNVPVFYNHFKKYHMEFICDTCGSKRSNKEKLIKHISSQHLGVTCPACGIYLKARRHLRQHTRRVHTVSRSEQAYCVACNKQFDNEIKFYHHFNMVHRTVTKKEYKCPSCDKVYTRRNYLNNHYRLEHEKKTKYYCTECDKYYLNGWRYKQHMSYTHEGKVRPKNNLCNLCGRGFSSNALLIKHIRVHTGERPFKCSVCDAAFTQKSALNTHRRCVHKIDRKPGVLIEQYT